MHLNEPAYQRTRARVEDYFDRTATRTWERLTSDAPVSGIRATVREGRDRMQAMILSEMPEGDLTGHRILDAGCGTGTLAIALAERGAEVVAIDISPSLIEIAESRTPRHLAHKVSYFAGDLSDPGLGSFDFVCAMDSLIYYDKAEIGSILAQLGPRVRTAVLFTLPPRTALLMAMWRVGKLFPRSDRSPVMVPHTSEGIATALRDHAAKGALMSRGAVNCGFYHSALYRFAPEGSR